MTSGLQEQLHAGNVHILFLPAPLVTGVLTRPAMGGIG